MFEIDLYDKLSKSLGYLEMDIPYYLNEEELKNIYWDKVNITYMNYNNSMLISEKDEEFFPMAIAQILSNSLSYLKSPVFNSIIDNSSFFNNTDDNKISFDYMTFLIIENGSNNILPNFFKKLIAIPEILSKFNFSQIKKIDITIMIYLIIMVIFCCLYFILFHFTNKSMIDGMDKVSKIKLE